MSYTFDEIIKEESEPKKERNFEGSNFKKEKLVPLDENFRTKMNNRMDEMWKVLKIEKYKSDFIDNGKYLLDKSGREFFHELLSKRMESAVWHRCIKKKEIILSL